MSSQVVTHGIPIPPEEIHSALRSAAVPGYTGALQIELSVLPEAARYVMIGIVRRQSSTATETTRENVPAIGDHVRKRSVQRAMDALQRKLVLRTVILAVEAHYVDGELKKWTVSE